MKGTAPLIKLNAETLPGVLKDYYRILSHKDTEETWNRLYKTCKEMEANHKTHVENFKDILGLSHLVSHMFKLQLILHDLQNTKSIQTLETYLPKITEHTNMIIHEVKTHHEIVNGEYAVKV